MTSNLSVGSHAIAATYSGDTDFAGVRSTPFSETVAPTTTQVVLVQFPVSRGRKRTTARQSSLRLTVEIEPAAPSVAIPTGEVTFELARSSRKKRKTITLGKAASQRPRGYFEPLGE